MKPIALMATFWFCLLVSGSTWGQDPVKPEGKADRLKALRTERLAILRNIAKQSTEAYKLGAASEDEVREANRMLHQAELELCDSDRDRIAVLEKIVAETKKAEQFAEELVKKKVGAPRTALKARADRLQAEIALEKARGGGAGQTRIERNDQTTPVDSHVAVKRAAVKVAEAQKKIALVKLTSVKAELVEAQAAEAAAEKQVKRIEDVARTGGVATARVEETRVQLEAARARRVTLDGKVAEYEAHVILEEARVEIAKLEVVEAEERAKERKSTGKDSY
jgi:hypothetical protein